MLSLVVGGAARAQEAATGAKEPMPEERRESLPEESERQEGEAPPTRLFKLEEMTVTATRTPRLIFETPRSVNLVTEERMQELNPLVALDSLKYEIGIFIEKRTSTTSDPIIRGFAGRNILALIDGNTLTTLWGEGGDGADDMYGKVDPDTIERIEVIRGPASVLYGSNAIGGVINFVTRRPAVDFTEEGFDTRFRLKTTYASAAQEGRIRGEAHLATPTFRVMLGASAYDADDVEGGRGLGTLIPSDGNARNWDLAAEYIPFGREHLFGLTVNQVRIDHAKRYYRPEQDNFNDRDSVGLFYTNTADNSIWERLEARLWYQYKKDRRRWLAGADEGLRGVAKTTTYSADLQLTSLPEIPLFSNHRLSYGVHWEYDNGEDPDDEQFTLYPPGGGTKEKQAPDSVWQNYAAFLQDEFDLTDRLSAIVSVRYDYFYFNSEPDRFYVPPDPDQDPSLDDVTEKSGEFSGGIGLSYRIVESTNIFANWSRGFRQNAPNFGLRLLSDIGWLTPNGFLDPIEADQFELGVKTSADGVSAGLAAYYTMIRNQQTITQGSFNGEDFRDENGNGVQDPGELPYLNTVTGDDADLKGVEAEAALRLDRVAEWIGRPDLIGPEWSVRGGFAWEIGQDDNIDGPMRWIHPAYGVASVRYDDFLRDMPFWVEFAGTFVRHHDRVPSGREDDPAWRQDPQDASQGPLRDYIGVPGYVVLDLRGGIDLTSNARLTLGVENLTDRKYRVAHSRMDAAGINFIASLDLWF